MRQEPFKFFDLVHLILESLRYLMLACTTFAFIECQDTAPITCMYINRLIGLVQDSVAVNYRYRRYKSI